jgi:hypothetical protein
MDSQVDEMRTMRVYGGIIHLISVADKTLAVEWEMGIGFKTVTAQCINLEVRDRIIVSKIKTRKSRLAITRRRISPLFLTLDPLPVAMPFSNGHGRQVDWQKG